MKVRFIGGPADGKVEEVSDKTVQVYFQEQDNYTFYIIHKLEGDNRSFYFACEGSIDEALERLLYENSVSG